MVFFLPAFLVTVGRLVSLTFVVCKWEERAEHRLVGLMLCKKTEAWQSSGASMMVTSCVTQCWYCPAEAKPTENKKSSARNSPFGQCRHKSPWKYHTRSRSGPRRCITDRLLAKADVIWAMHERERLCHLLRETQGDSRINHILRAHGHIIQREEEAAKIFEVGTRSLERLFPGFTVHSSDQAALSAGESAVGYKRFVDVAVQHTLEPSFGAQQQPDSCQNNFFLTRLDTSIGAASAAFFRALDDSESPTAQLYLQKAAHAADEAWQQSARCRTRDPHLPAR